MPDLREDLNEFRSTNTSNLLPVGAAYHVARAVIRDRRLWWIRIGARHCCSTAADRRLRETHLTAVGCRRRGRDALCGLWKSHRHPTARAAYGKVVTAKRAVKGSVAGRELKDVSVTGYPGAWQQNGTVYVAATGDASTVEAQVRTPGYRGPLFVGRLATPTADEILLSISASTLRGGGLMTSSQVLMNGGRQVEATVLANVPGGQQILAKDVTAVATGVGVDVSPALLTAS